MNFQEIYIKPKNFSSSDFRNRKLPIEYTGALSNTMYGLKYKHISTSIIEMGHNEDIIFVIMLEILTNGFMGIKRKIIENLENLSRIKEYIFEKATKKQKVDFYGIFNVEIKLENKNINAQLDINTISEIFYWFKKDKIDIVFKNGIVMFNDKENQLLNIQEYIKKIEAGLKLDDGDKEKIISEFIKPFKYEDNITLETKINYLSRLKNMITIFNAELWEQVSIDERIFGGSWIFSEESILSSKEFLFDISNISDMIIKYLK